MNRAIVGIFPHGAAACGAEELAGNVWEWCSTPPVDYPFKGKVSAESLYTRNKRASSAYVLRGGSWNNNRDNARFAYRNDDNPDNDNNGFRLATRASRSPEMRRDALSQSGGHGAEVFRKRQAGSGFALSEPNSTCAALYGRRTPAATVMVWRLYHRCTRLLPVQRACHCRWNVSGARRRAGSATRRSRRT